MPVHPSAWIHPDVQLDDSITVGPQAVIEAGVEIGAGTHIGPGAVLLGPLTVGENCRIHSHAVLGDVPQDRAYGTEQTACHIGSDCIIREGVTVHRSTGDGTETRIGDRCFLMTNSHVAHNCVLGNDVTLVSGALLGGHVKVGDRAIISGNAAVHQFVRIGELAIVGGLSKIVQDVPPYLMTDQTGGIAGLNLVGLVRAGSSSEARHELKRFYRLMYREQKSRQDSLDIMTTDAQTPEGRLFLEFIAFDSKRGIRKGRK